MNPIKDPRTAGLAVFVLGATGLAVLFVPPFYAALIPASLIGLWKPASELEKYEREKIGAAIGQHRKNGDLDAISQIATAVREDRWALVKDATLREKFEKVLALLCFSAEKSSASAAWRDALDGEEWNNLRIVLFAYLPNLGPCYPDCEASSNCEANTNCNHRSVLRLCQALKLDPRPSLWRRRHRD
jgi:hypothetical protein